jgi:CCR4-NOT complex subunit CAF16
MPSDTEVLAIDCPDLTFAWAADAEPVLDNVQLQLQRGDRCLLIGANGGE